MKRCLAMLWMALFLLFGTGVTAVQAHAGLISSTPKEGEVLKENPGQISMRFTETLEPDLVSIRFYDWNGQEIQVGHPTLQPGDATQVNVQLPDLAQGTYTAILSVVSEDGHPVEERLSFSIGQKSAAIVAPSEQKQGSNYLIVYRYLVQGIILLGGGFYLLAWRGKKYGLPGSSEILGNGRKVVWALALIGLCFLWFLYDESLPAVSLTAALAQGNFSVVMQSPFAMMLLVSLLFLLLLAIPGMIAEWYVTIWVLLIGTQAFGGHAWGISPVWLAILLRLFHVLTVAVWLGALLYLSAVNKQAVVGNEGFKRFFLRTVALAASLAVVTGGLMLLVQTDIALVLSSSLTWSYLLYAKIACVCVMLVIAYRQTKHWRRGDALKPRLLQWEIVFGVLAILAGLWMSQTNYPTDRTDVQTTMHSTNM